jgi:prevent-host-death family protein
MASHSVAEAKNQLSDLIDRALAGEGVIITRHGRPVVEIRPVQAPAQAVSLADLDWLAARRVGHKPVKGDAGALVSGMRDDEER